ncbi:MAG: 4Fe-4S binding protein [Desulfurivibrionaceae bacterium]
MKSDHVVLAYFSPTSTTKQVLEYIAQGVEPGSVHHVDITLPEGDAAEYSFLQSDLVLLGVPVYGGRVPLLAEERLQKIKIREIPAVVVVVYGNRAYDDALVELKDLAEYCGFVPVAGGAFIGEHSFASEDTPIANGRPDENDAAEARTFGGRIKNMLACVSLPRELGLLQVPGNVPYKERMERKDVAPVADPELCTLCGTCADSCPSGAISINEEVQADPTTCILCHACVKNCPTGAMAFQSPPLKEIAGMLSRDCQARKKPEIFMPER